MSDFQDKVRSISTPRRLGESETKRKRADGSEVETTTHWDGRQDAVVRPATVRQGARTHSTGKKRGQIAEVVPLSRKQRKEKYGESS